MKVYRACIDCSRPRVELLLGTELVPVVRDYPDCWYAVSFASSWCFPDADKTPSLHEQYQFVYAQILVVIYLI